MKTGLLILVAVIAPLAQAWALWRWLSDSLREGVRLGANA